MHKYLLGTFVGFTAVLCTAVFAFAAVPAAKLPTAPTGYVSDFAHMFAPDTVARVNAELTQFEKETGNEISVVTVSSLQGEPIEDFAVSLFEKWGIGKKGADNGVLLLISKDDRKVRIETGYGTEAYITDGQAGDIIRTDITPNFKEGKYDTGMELAVKSIESRLTGLSSPKASGKMDSQTFEFVAGAIFFAIYIVLIFLSATVRWLAKSPSYFAGGALGGVLGVLLGAAASLYFGVVALAIFAVVGVVLGSLFDFVLSHTYARYVADRGAEPWWAKKRDVARGIWFLGNISGGGSSGGGGGFGGFGGGSSGGGGASGSW